MENFWKMEAIFPKTCSPKNCNLGIFRGLKSKSGYFLGFSKKIFDEHTYHFYIKSAPPGHSARKLDHLRLLAPLCLYN